LPDAVPCAEITEVNVSSDRVRKGEVKMFALMRAIRDFWEACAAVPGRVVPGGQLEIDSLDGVIVALDHALVTIRTLDLEVFSASDESNYLLLRDGQSSREGTTVRALIAPRHNAVHHPDVIDPHIASAAGPVPGTQWFVINPRWKLRSEVPSGMFRTQNGKPNPGNERAYDTAAAGIPILDTLLDATPPR
jgi:hypothetical protein